MKKFTVNRTDEGQTLIKYTSKILSRAPMSVIRKALRKKNIDLNKKKADGSEILKAGDEIQIWFSDETFEKFLSLGEKLKSEETEKRKVTDKNLKDFKKNILYEDENVLLINKPSGILTQADDSDNVSLNDILIVYYKDIFKLRTFKPSICNRLDRNTSGIVIAGKTIKGLQKMNELIKKREVRKFYITIALGEIKGGLYTAWLKKDSKKNKVSIYDNEVEGSVEIKTFINPLGIIKKDGYTLSFLEIELITGRPHQIRAHLSHIGNPVLGDCKYANKESTAVSEKLAVKRQMLHACRLEFPKLKDEFAGLSQKQVEAAIPADMNSILKFR